MVQHLGPDELAGLVEFGDRGRVALQDGDQLLYDVEHGLLAELFELLVVAVVLHRAGLSRFRPALSRLAHLHLHHQHLLLLRTHVLLLAIEVLLVLDLGSEFLLPVGEETAGAVLAVAGLEIGAEGSLVVVDVVHLRSHVDSAAAHLVHDGELGLLRHWLGYQETNVTSSSRLRSCCPCAKPQRSPSWHTPFSRSLERIDTFEVSAKEGFVPSTVHVVIRYNYNYIARGLSCIYILLGIISWSSYNILQ